MGVSARTRGWNVALGAVVLALTAACGGPGATAPTTRPSGTSPGASTTTAPATTTTTPPGTSTTTPSPPSTTTTTPSAPVVTTLSLGDRGPAVLRLQQQLTALGYWLGPADGVFGDSTQQAVYALQKAAGISRDGIVGPQTAAALARATVPQPRPAAGHVVEIDLERDLFMIVNDGKLDFVLNTSTGGGYTYVDQGVTAVAQTPVGIFHVFRQVDGMVTSSLGELWRPKFFYGGYAMHGSSYVPPYPASHGCVRLSNEAIDWIWASNQVPIGTEVWVY